MTTAIAIFAALSALAALSLLALRLHACRQQSTAEIRALKRRLEQDLTTAHDDRNKMLDALGDAFLLVDAQSHIRFANAAAHALFGNRDLMHRPVSEIFLDSRLAQALQHCLASGEPVQSRVVLAQQASPRGDLETRATNVWLIDAARLPAAPEGSPLTRVILRDVTTEHQTEQIRRDFVANASHELRTPMAIINGYLENLLDDNLLDDPATARHFLSIMRKHAERISRIVEDMLVISRLESGAAGSLNIEPFRFRSCIQDVLERLESVIRSQQADVQVTMPDTNLVMHGDRYYWTQVLFNLIENALKQNPLPGLQVEIGGEETDNCYHIWVLDDGVGIPSADLPHIFRRFYRVEKHHSQREIKGTGLGLSIVKRAVEAHGGSISVSSVPGRETKFLITLPKLP
jgi:two-component system phosphate regulon sensor histidine kinase PhoR